MIRITQEIDKEVVHQWDELINEHPNGSFFQSYLYFKSLESQKNHKPFVFIAKEKDIVTGVLVAVLHSEAIGALKFLTKRAIVIGGPVIKSSNSNVVLRQLLTVFNQTMKKYAIVSQFRNAFDTDVWKNDFIYHKYKYEEHLNIIVNLRVSGEVLWGNVHTKRRNEIRKAQKEGTSFEVRDDFQSLEETYKILKQVYQRAKLPLPQLSFFKSIIEVIGYDHFKIFVAINSGKIIGVMYAICFKDRIFDWFAGAYEEFYDKHPNDIIPWSVFLWGKEAGFCEFDFGGAGKPRVPYGVRDYKKKFGGVFVNYGRYERINSKMLYKIALIGFRIWRMLKDIR